MKHGALVAMANKYGDTPLSKARPRLRKKLEGIMCVTRRIMQWTVGSLSGVCRRMLQMCYGRFFLGLGCEVLANAEGTYAWRSWSAVAVVAFD